MGKAKNLANKAASADAAEAAINAREEAERAADWSVGAKNDKKGAAKAEAEAERIRKQREKAELESQEASEASSVKSSVKKTGKKSKKDDTFMLEAALAAAPKSKAQKAAEAKKKADEDAKKARILLEEKKAAAKAAAYDKDADNRARMAAKGIVDNSDDIFSHSKSHNKLDTEEEMNASGIESALGGLKMAFSAGGDDPEAHPEKRMKAAYNEYFEIQLPIFKQEHPNLKLSQYKERIFDAWKKAPENPLNKAKADRAAPDAPDSVFSLS